MKELNLNTRVHITAPTNFDSVIKFMQAMDQEVLDRPALRDKPVSDLRIKLIEEEVQELREAIAEGDLVEIADALADILYVTYGAAAAYGIDIDEVFEEVHASNMTKLGPDGKAIKNEYGKVVKPPTYRPPEVKQTIDWQIKQGWRFSEDLPDPNC